jgi:hypothetical protein
VEHLKRLNSTCYRGVLTAFLEETGRTKLLEEQVNQVKLQEISIAVFALEHCGN